MDITMFGQPDLVSRKPLDIPGTQWVALPFSPHPKPGEVVLEPRITLALLNAEGDFSYIISRMSTEEARQLRAQLDKVIKYREEKDEKKILS